MKPVAVVTGGSSGIGLAVVTRLREQGWEALSLSRREGTDVADEQQVLNAFARLSRLDSLVHCAATLQRGPLVETSAAAWDEQLGAALRGAFLCCREAFRRMHESGGTIVLVSSLSGVAGAEKFAGMAPYVAAKSGLAGLNEALAAEGRPLGIRVNAVSPGSVDTPMMAAAGIGGPCLQPDDVAATVAWLASPESAPLSGANLRMDPDPGRVEGTTR